MQMKALRSANFAKLASSSSTRDVYCDTSISAGTPAGYCLSQMRSMVLPLWFGPRLLGRDAAFGAVLSNGAADGKRQRVVTRSPAGRKERAGSARPKPGLTAGRGGGLLSRRLGLGGALGFDRRLCGSLRLGRLRGGLVTGGDRLFAGFWGARRLGIHVSDGGRPCSGLRIGLGLLLGLAGILIRAIRLFRRNPRFLSPRPRGLLFGVPGHGGNQCGAGLGRTRIDRYWLRGRGRRRQQLRRFYHRRLQSGGEEGDRSLATGRAAGRGVAGNGLLILVAGGPLAFSSAHLVAQVRGRGVDRHQIVDCAERGAQPRQRVVGKTPLEQLRRFRRARVAG